MTSVVAVIEIGSKEMRLLVSEIKDDGNRNILDSAKTPLLLGSDVFTTGIVGRDSLLQCIHILLRFKEQLAAWGISPPQAIVIATSALQEAKNIDTVLDRINIKTGFTVKVIDGTESSRLIYLAVMQCIESEGAALHYQNSLIIDVGGLSTDLVLIKNGKVVGAHTMRLGTVIIEHQMHSSFGAISDARRYAAEFIRNTKVSLSNEIDLKKIKQFIALSHDIQIAAINIGKHVSSHLIEIGREKFEHFVDEIYSCTAEECADRFCIPYNEALVMNISLLVYEMFFKLTNARNLIAADTSIRDGLVIERAAISEDLQSHIFYNQTIASAVNLLKKYKGDEKHAQYVRKISTKLYDGLQTEILLDNRARMLLEVSAILHDIGMFIAPDSHETHSEYIIRNSEIFGIKSEDISAVSLIARYHRGNRMMQDDWRFCALSGADRIMILKLTAILRVADALDRSHEQRMSVFTIKLEKNTMIIHTKTDHRYQLEKLALVQKGGMFESVFGYKAIIV